MSNGKSENYLRKPRSTTARKGKPYVGSNKPACHRIRQISKKKREENKVYAQLRKQFLSDHPICAVWAFRDDLPLGQALMNRDHQSTEIHHMRGRSKYLLDVSTWAAVSSRGHKLIHENPLWAEAHGLLHPQRNSRGCHESNHADKYTYHL